MRQQDPSKSRIELRCRIRKLCSEDLDSLSRIYSDSILQLGNEYYSAEQVTAWASFSADTEEFNAWLIDATTLVAVDTSDTCLGFGSFQSQGRVSSLFVAPEFQRMGLGSKLLERLMEEARSRAFAMITTEASEFSRPLFEKYGFVITEVERSKFKGVDFTRYAMQARI